VKIVLLHQYFTTPTMNGGTRSYETTRRLAGMGHEVEVLTSIRAATRRRGWSSSVEQGVRVHWYPVPYSNHMGAFRRIAAFFTFAAQASRRLSQIDADLIFATSTPLTIAIPAVFASRIKRVPMVFEVRDLWPEVPIAMGMIKNPLLKFLARSLEKWAYANSSAVVALSPQMKEGVMAAGFPASNISVIPNACDFNLFLHNKDAAENFFTTRPYLRGRPIVLYPGTFGAVNGLSYAVDLANELYALGSDVAILLVGEGKEKEKITRQANVLGVLGANLFIEDAVPKTDVAAMFSASTCVANFVAPITALYANSANKFFDALAAGKPVLLNFDGWMTKIVTQRDCGLDTSQLSLRQSAKLLDSKLHDLPWLASARAAAQRVALEYFSRDELVTQLNSVIRMTEQGKGNRSEQIAPGIYH